MPTRRDLLKWGALTGAASLVPAAWGDHGGRNGGGNPFSGGGNSGAKGGNDTGGSGKGGSGKGGVQTFSTPTSTKSGETTTSSNGYIDGNINGNRIPDNLQASPHTAKYAIEMPRVTDAIARDPGTFTGAPIDPVKCISPGDAVQRSAKQAYNRFKPVKWYEIFERQNDTYSWHPDLPKQPLWGFDGIFPGPCIRTKHGEPILVRWHNALPTVNKLGFGLPSTTTHLHNFHTASESDGFPTDYINAGQFHDSHYTMTCPGWSMGAEDEREMLNTMWYHDHRQDFTAQNTYAGLVGWFLQCDERDSGDENDSNPNAYRLPSGDYDVPIVFADKAFNPNSGLLYFDLFNFDGMLGDKHTANGVIQPYFRVEPRKYRFRFLVGGPSRFYSFKLAIGTPMGAAATMTQITEDGNFLPLGPQPQLYIDVTPAERKDVIIDFSRFPKGSSVFLMNIANQNNGRGPNDRNMLPVGDEVVRFDIVLDSKGPDNSRIPSSFRPAPEINLSEVKAQRTFRFERSGGGWAVNGRIFDANRIDAHVKQNTAEIWTIQNNSGSWSHPIHIHFEEHRILSRNGIAPPTWERGRKDVIRLHPNEEVKIFMRFRDWTGRYPMHCHNTVHEDHAMMIRWDLEA